MTRHVIDAQNRLGRLHHLLLRGACHHQNHLPPRWIVMDGSNDTAHTSPSNLLVILRQLPAQGHRTVRTERLRDVVHGLPDPMGRLIEHHRAYLGAQRAQTPDPFPMPARQESLIAETVRREPRQRQGIENGTGTGSACQGKPAVDGAMRYGRPGIVDQRHARIRHDQNGRAALDLIKQPGTQGSFVVVMVGHDPARNMDAQPAGEIIQPSGVLRRHDVGMSEQIHQSRRSVRHIADGRRSEDHAADVIPTSRSGSRL